MNSRDIRTTLWHRPRTQSTSYPLRHALSMRSMKNKNINIFFIPSPPFFKAPKLFCTSVFLAWPPKWMWANDICQKIPELKGNEFHGIQESGEWNVYFLTLNTFENISLNYMNFINKFIIKLLFNKNPPHFMFPTTLVNLSSFEIILRSLPSNEQIAGEDKGDERRR